MYTTLNEIRAHDPCAEGWEKLLKHLGKTEADDEPVSYLTILEGNGLDDAIWALIACPDQNLVRKFACDCAEHALHIFEKEHPDDKRPRQAIEVSRAFTEGKASKEELDAASAAAWAAASTADWAARTAASTADWAASAAARAAARTASTAARTAAWAAARTAARNAARNAAWAAASDAEVEWQTLLFKEYFAPLDTLDEEQRA